MSSVVKSTQESDFKKNITSAEVTVTCMNTTWVLLNENRLIHTWKKIYIKLHYCGSDVACNLQNN